MSEPLPSSLAHARYEIKTMNTFEGIPAELRLEIYKELLVTDCAYRLAHFGPFSHIPRKPLDSSILRANKAIYAEAREILYGHNTFFLGPIDHKPSLTASLPESIGKQNTSLIRFVVLHSTLYSCLDRQAIERFLADQTIDPNQLKVLAISMPEDSPFISAIPAQPLVPPLATLGSQWHSAITFNSAPQHPLPPPLAHPAFPAQNPLSEETGKLIKAVHKCGGWVEICAGGKRGVEELGIKTPNCDLRAGHGWVVRIGPGVRRSVEVWV